MRIHKLATYNRNIRSSTQAAFDLSSFKELPLAGDILEIYVKPLKTIVKKQVNKAAWLDDKRTKDEICEEPIVPTQVKFGRHKVHRVIFENISEII